MTPEEQKLRNFLIAFSNLTNKIMADNHIYLVVRPDADPRLADNHESLSYSQKQVIAHEKQEKAKVEIEREALSAARLLKTLVMSNWKVAQTPEELDISERQKSLLDTEPTSFKLFKKVD